MLTSGSSMEIKRADHTGFTVSSLDEALDFWVNVMGFPIVYRDTFEPSSFLDNLVGVKGAALALAMVEAPGGHLIELLEYRAPGERQVMYPRACDIGSVHVAFVVNDIDAVLGRVEQHGWQRLGAPQTVSEGKRKGLKLAYMRGPDGVTVELLQLPA